MNRAVLLMMIIWALGFSACSNEEIEDGSSISVNDLKIEASLQAKTVELVNVYRVSKGKKNLNFNEEAYKMALAHTQYMAQKAVLAHSDFENRAKGLADKIGAEIVVAENLSRNFDTAEDTVQEWLKSTGHRNNILGDYTYTAAAVVSTPDGDVYYTQVFFRMIE